METAQLTETDCKNNISVGRNAGYCLITGSHNIFIGDGSGQNLTTSDYRLIAKGKNLNGKWVNIDKTMSAEEHESLYKIVWAEMKKWSEQRFTNKPQSFLNKPKSLLNAQEIALTVVSDFLKKDKDAKALDAIQVKLNATDKLTFAEKNILNIYKTNQAKSKKINIEFLTEIKNN